MLQKYSIYIEWNELNGIKQFSSLCLELYFVFNSESQKFSLISCIACRLILPNLICASVIRLCRLLLLPRWSLSWLSVLKHWWSKQMKSQDFLFNREIDAWHSFTISTDSETVTVQFCYILSVLGLTSRFFYQVRGLVFSWSHLCNEYFIFSYPSYSNRLIEIQSNCLQETFFKFLLFPTPDFCSCTINLYIYIFLLWSK